jgi:hypothetical protein
VKNSAAVNRAAAQIEDREEWGFEASKPANSETTTIVPMISQLQSIEIGIPRIRTSGNVWGRPPMGLGVVLAATGKWITIV